VLDSQLFRTSAGAIKDTADWPVPGPPVWTGAGGGVGAETLPAIPKIGKGKALFFDQSDCVDLTVPEQGDLSMV